MKLQRTPAGHLLIWERGTTRYTLGYRVSRNLKRFHFMRWVATIRPFSAHFIAFPLTEAQKRANASSRKGGQA